MRDRSPAKAVPVVARRKLVCPSTHSNRLVKQVICNRLTQRTQRKLRDAESQTRPRTRRELRSSEYHEPPFFPINGFFLWFYTDPRNAKRDVLRSSPTKSVLVFDGADGLRKRPRLSPLRCP